MSRKDKSKKGQSFSKDRLRAVCEDIHRKRSVAAMREKSTSLALEQGITVCCAVAQLPVSEPARRLAEPQTKKLWWENLPHYKKRSATAGNQP